MKIENFNYHLDKKLIAQKPIRPRENSRLMVVSKKSNKIQLDHFFNLTKYLKKGDVLVFNDTKVIPARLIGKKKTGGRVEILLLNKVKKGIWEALIRARKKEEGMEINFSHNLSAKIIKQEEKNIWLIEFNKNGQDFRKIIQKIGQAPLPPYIKKMTPLPDYQTIFAKKSGSVAASTAGFHFSQKLINKLLKNKIQIEFVTLHVGLGTFLPIQSDDLEKHKIHSEKKEISKSVCDSLNKAKREGKRIIAVGTTSCRVLESAANKKGHLRPIKGETSLFIYPGYKFKFIDGLITNFHLPMSTLLLLVCAFAGKNRIFRSYKKAIEEKFRFYSFGDGMLIV